VPQDPTTIKNVRLNEVFLRPLPNDMSTESLKQFVSNSGFLFKEIRLFDGNGGNKSAFIKFHCDADASKALNYFQNVVLDGMSLRTRYTVDYFEDDKEPRDKSNEQISKIRQAFTWIDKHCKTQDHDRLPRELAEITPQPYKAPRQLGNLLKTQCTDKHPECKVFDQVYRARSGKPVLTLVSVPEREVEFCELDEKMRLLQTPPPLPDLPQCTRVYSIAETIQPPPQPKRGIGRGYIKQRLANVSSPPKSPSTSAPTEPRPDDMESNSSGIFSDVDSDTASVKQEHFEDVPSNIEPEVPVVKSGRGRGGGVLLLARQGMLGN